MIAKLIVHGDRADAIAKMREALNGFVIRGVSATFPSRPRCWPPGLCDGQVQHRFIAQHYAHGFRAEHVPHDDPRFLAALAGFIRRKALKREAGISGQLPGHEVRIEHDYVAVVNLGGGNNARHAVHVSEFAGQTGRPPSRSMAPSTGSPASRASTTCASPAPWTPAEVRGRSRLRPSAAPPRTRWPTASSTAVSA